MRIGILSDTHDCIGRTQAAIRLLQAAGAEAILHCGDITTPEIVEICAVLPAFYTFGNHDADNVPRLTEAIARNGGTCLGWGGEITLAGKRLALVHGHMHIDVRRVLATSPDHLFSGHSHIPLDVQAGQTRRINPGALCAADMYTVALLDLERGNVEVRTIEDAPEKKS